MLNINAADSVSPPLLFLTQNIHAKILDVPVQKQNLT